MISTISKFKTEAKMALPCVKGEHDTNIFLNDSEYPAIVGYRDEGTHSMFVCKPEIIVESIIICPCVGLVIDLYSDAYEWLVTGQIEDSLKDEIEEAIKKEHAESCAFLRHCQKTWP